MFSSCEHKTLFRAGGDVLCVVKGPLCHSIWCINMSKILLCFSYLLYVFPPLLYTLSMYITRCRIQTKFAHFSHAICFSILHLIRVFSLLLLFFALFMFYSRLDSYAVCWIFGLCYSFRMHMFSISISPGSPVFLHLPFVH